MNPLFRGIKSVGFDLDDTLYPNIPSVDEQIRKNATALVLNKKPELQTTQKARQFYEQRHAITESGTQIMKELGFKDPEEVMVQCHANTNILDLLKRDESLVSLIQQIKERYQTFLITATYKYLAVQRLEALGISPDSFDISVFGDSSKGISKSDGSVYDYFLSLSPNSPKQHVYIGDSVRRDIIHPRNLGMKTILVGEDDSRAHASVGRIHDISDLLL
tara:strand:- start:2467 stop:3123 length:657 start_codon:yes stop_codon:yes gene_type:complete